MKPKFITSQIEELEDLMKGMIANPDAWAGQPRTVADVDDAIAQLKQTGDDVDTAEKA